MFNWIIFVIFSNSFFIINKKIYQNNIYDIPYKKLKKRGIKCLLFDLDNTIAPLNVSEPDSKFLDFVYKLQDDGFKVIILSNASKARVAPFKEIANLDSAYHSMKPLKKKYQRIMKMYKYKDVYLPKYEVLDGRSWSFCARFSDGSEISSHGSNAGPKDDGLERIYNYMVELVEDGIQIESPDE